MKTARRIKKAVWQNNIVKSEEEKKMHLANSYVYIMGNINTSNYGRRFIHSFSSCHFFFTKSITNYLSVHVFILFDEKPERRKKIIQRGFIASAIWAVFLKENASKFTW